MLQEGEFGFASHQRSNDKRDDWLIGNLQVDTWQTGKQLTN